MNRFRSLPVVALCTAATAAFTGCHSARVTTVAGGRDVAVSQSAAADTTIRGVVRATSAQPVSQLVVRPNDAGAGVAVIGGLRQEISSLDGVEIEAHGIAQPNQPPIPPTAVDVTRYEIVSVGGLAAHDGILKRGTDGLWLAGARDTVQLADPVPETLAGLVGRRVYVGGVMRDGRLVVQAFGAVGSAARP